MTTDPNLLPAPATASVPRQRQARRAACVLAIALGSPFLGGCAVIAVADLAASVVIGTAGLAVDAAVGTAKIAGKVVGKTADVMLGSEAEP